MKIEGAIFDLDGTLMNSMFIRDTTSGDCLLSRSITPRENLNETFKKMSRISSTLPVVIGIYDKSETDTQTVSTSADIFICSFDEMEVYPNE